MTPKHSRGPKTLMKGELYQAPSDESWRVALAPNSSDEISAITNETEFGQKGTGVEERTAITEERSAHGKGDAVSDCSTKSKESIDFLKDDKRDMTFSRRIALSLMNKKWYNPRANESPEQNHEVKSTGTSSSSSKIDDFDANMSNARPSLEKSWAYFEHVALYRYLLSEDEIGSKSNIFKRIWNILRGRTKLERAEPGESDDPTRLYHPLLTPHSQLGYVRRT